MSYTFDTAALGRVAEAAAKAGLPAIENAIQLGMQAAAAPYGMGFIPAMVLPTLFAMMNKALGLEADATPDQTAAKIEADPDAASAALATLNAQQQFMLDQQKQADETRIAAQAQQTVLVAADQASGSWFARSWRPAAAWVCVVALAIDAVVIPIASWVALAVYGHQSPPPPDMTLLLSLLGGMLGLGIMRTSDKQAVVKAVANVAARR